jgi:hypothetical protein
MEPGQLTVVHPKQGKVFWFFFSKKNGFLPYSAGVNSIDAAIFPNT